MFLNSSQTEAFVWFIFSESEAAVLFMLSQIPHRFLILTLPKLFTGVMYCNGTCRKHFVPAQGLSCSSPPHRDPTEIPQRSHRLSHRDPTNIPPMIPPISHRDPTEIPPRSHSISSQLLFFCSLKPLFTPILFFFLHFILFSALSKLLLSVTSTRR